MCAITETWLTDAISSTEFCPDGYQVFRQDRDVSFYEDGVYSRDDRGGSLLLIKENLNAQQICLNVKCEAVLTTIEPSPGHKLQIGVIYRSERGHLQNMSNICNFINTLENYDTILVGDFNLPGITWENPEPNSILETLFLEAVQDKLLSQMVMEPTRGSNILDLMFVSNPEMVESCDVILPLGQSDHNGTKLEYKVNVKRTNSEPRKVFLYSKGDYPGFRKAVEDIEWERIFKHRTLEQSWEVFKQIYYKLLDKFIPYKFIKPKSKHKPPWYKSRKIKIARRKQRTKFVHASKTGLNADRELYLKSQQETKLAVKQAKSEFEGILANKVKDEPKKFFNYTRHFIRSTSTVETLIENDHQFTEDKDKAKILNDFFTSVMVDEPEVLGSIPIQSSSSTKFISNVDITPAKVRKKLQKMKRDKGSGPDSIHSNVLKEVITLDIPLSLLFNKSMREGYLPQDWRDANVTPIHKGGHRTKKENYRPISLTSQVVKLLEKIILDDVWKHIGRARLLSCDQHGFQKGCSCITNLLESLNDWLNIYDRGGSIVNY